MKRYVIPIAALASLLMAFAPGCQQTAQSQTDMQQKKADKHQDHAAVRNPEALPDEPWYITKD